MVINRDVFVLHMEFGMMDHLSPPFPTQLFSMSNSALDRLVDTSSDILKLSHYKGMELIPINPLLKWQPTPVFLPRKFHGWRSLVGYSPWGLKESDMTEPSPIPEGQGEATEGKY